MYNAVLGFIYSHIATTTSTNSISVQRLLHFSFALFFSVFPLFSITSLRLTECIVIRVNRMPINMHPPGFPFHYPTYTNSCPVSMLVCTPHTDQICSSLHFSSLLSQTIKRSIALIKERIFPT